MQTRLGRPPGDPMKSKRELVAVRMAIDLKRWIMAAAEKNGHSQSEEAERRLRASFATEAAREAQPANLESGVCMIGAGHRPEDVTGLKPKS